MEGHKRCAECSRIGRKCVNLSWEALDRTRDEYRKKVEEDEEELAKLLARLMRDKKILRQADNRAKQKSECLAAELEASSAMDQDDDCPAADACVNLSPAVWTTLDFVNSATDPFYGLGPDTALSGSSS